MRASRRLAPLALAAALFVASSARADVTLNLKDAEIATLISTVSEVTGKNFIVDPRVKGKVTVISAKPMNSRAVYETFLAVLQVQGFAAVPAGNAIKIIPETNARSDAGMLNSDGRNLPIDDVVTHVYTMQNISAAQLVPILRPLIPQWGHLAAYPGNNMLIISDRAGNVARLEEIIRRMDSAGDKDIDSIVLENASATEVVRILTAMIQAAKTADPTATSATVIADERSNAVLIGGERPERDRIASIVRRLDLPLKESDNNTQVVYLNYASAENLAPILEGYAQQIKDSGNRTGGTSGGAAAPAGAAGGGASGGSSNGEIKVLAEKDTNALVITAPPKAMRQLKSVIEQLDIQRSQVLVEAIIAEISDSKSSQLGLDFAAYNPNGGAIASLLSQSTIAALGALGTAGTSSISGAQIAAGLLGGGVTAGGVSIRDNGTSFAVILRALQSDGDSNVLSTPSLVSLDNEESEVKVGQEVPFRTGSFSTANSSTNNPFTTVERKDVGLTLGVTPQINAGDTVKLKIKLESSSLAASVSGASDLITNKRTITNTVNVESGQVLVLGGLIDDNATDSINGVPYLSKVPLLGALFRSRSVTKARRNLVVFIHPTILRNRDQGDFFTRRKYDSVRTAQLRSTNGAAPMVGTKAAVLPDFNTYVRLNTPPGAQPAAPTRTPVLGPAEILPPLPPAPPIGPASAPSSRSSAAPATPALAPRAVAPRRAMAPTPIPAATPAPAPAPVVVMPTPRVAAAYPTERPRTLSYSVQPRALPTPVAAPASTRKRRAATGPDAEAGSATTPSRKSAGKTPSNVIVIPAQRPQAPASE